MILVLLPGPSHFQAITSMREFVEAEIFEKESQNYAHIASYFYHGVPTVYFAHYESDDDIKMHVREFVKHVSDLCVTNYHMAMHARIITKGFTRQRTVMLMDYMEFWNTPARLWLNADDPNSVNTNHNILT